MILKIEIKIKLNKVRLFWITSNIFKKSKSFDRFVSNPNNLNEINLKKNIANPHNNKVSLKLMFSFKKKISRKRDRWCGRKSAIWNN